MLSQTSSINSREAFTTMSSSSSGSTTSDTKKFNTNGSHDADFKKTEDPVYSDPLDALEKATDTRIYNSPEFKENTFTSLFRIFMRKQIT